MRQVNKVQRAFCICLQGEHRFRFCNKILRIIFANIRAGYKGAAGGCHLLICRRRRDENRASLPLLLSTATPCERNLFSLFRSNAISDFSEPAYISFIIKITERNTVQNGPLLHLLRAGEIQFNIELKINHARARQNIEHGRGCRPSLNMGAIN